MISTSTARVLALVTASVLGSPICLTSAAADGLAEDAEFPYVIQMDLGSIEFAPGDNIVIASVRGDREHFEVGGHYLLEGSYTLVSSESADLAWYSTSRGPSGSTPVMEDQHVKISAGSGNFRLKKTMTDDGWLHVSFYVDKHSHGGLYFGEKGFENSVLRQKGWSDFSKPSSLQKPLSATEGFGAAGVVAAGQGNAAIMAYLGDPVAAPADLNSKYWPTNLAAAFSAMGSKLGWRIEKLAVDDSEFPYLVYGIIDGKHELLEKDIREMEGYDYSGSVRGSTEKGTTYFSLNMIPHSQYPAGQTVACHRRLMVRLQMLAEAAQQSE